MGSADGLTDWLVVIDFFRAASFEVRVRTKTKNEAMIMAEEAAIAAGWADAELRQITCFPQVEKVA